MPVTLDEKPNSLPEKPRTGNSGHIEVRCGTFEPLLSAEEAAQHLRMHVKTVQKMAREGVVPCLRMRKYWRFRLSALDQWVSSQEELGQPTATA
jgi:excisionase family DNA binding protein